MRVIIRRTSLSFDTETPPFEGATLVEIPQWDQRTFASSEAHDERFARDKWLSRGTDHGVNDIGIYRRIGFEICWVIEATSLESLIESIGKDVVIALTSELARRSHPDIKFVVEIYDDYRE